MSDELPNEAVHETWMAFYIRKRKFAECMILGWQTVEYYLNQMILQEERADLILKKAGFQTKLKLLKDMGRLSQSDYDTILDFRDERNRLFHGNVLAIHPTAVPEKEKTRLMELANRASQIVVNRGFGVWVDEGTGDIGNKNVPKRQNPIDLKALRRDHPTKSNRLRIR